MAKKKKKRMTVREWFADKRDMILDWRDDVLDWWDDLDPAKRRLGVSLIVAAVVLVAVLVAYGVTNGFNGFASLGNNQETQSISEEVYEPAGANDPIEQTQQISSEDAQALGYDIERAYNDEIAIKDFCRVAFNFANQEDYVSHCNQLSESYKGFSNWQIATEFMPEQYVGDTYELMFMQVEAYVTGVDGDVYSYTCDATVRTKSPNGGQATGEILLLVTTYGDGSFKDVKAYPTTAIS